MPLFNRIANRQRTFERNRQSHFSASKSIANTIATVIQKLEWLLSSLNLKINHFVKRMFEEHFEYLNNNNLCIKKAFSKIDVRTIYMIAFVFTQSRVFKYASLDLVQVFKELDSFVQRAGGSLFRSLTLFPFRSGLDEHLV